MVLKNKLVSDLELRLSKFKPHRDMDFNRSLIEFWIDSSRDMLVYQKITGELADRNIIDPEFIFTEPLTPALDAPSGEYVIQTTYPIIQLPDDRGIVSIVEPSTPYRLLKTDYDEVDIIDDLRYAKSSPTRLFWYRDSQDGIILKGADATALGLTLLTKYVRADWGTDTLLTEVYPITSDLIDMLLENAFQKGLQAIQAGQPDVFTNDIPGE